MKRHTSETGNKKWFSDYFVELQSESLSAIDEIASSLGQCVLSGCEIVSSGVEFRIKDGLVVLKCEDNIYRCMPFFETLVTMNDTARLYYYFIVEKTAINGEYENPVNTIIAYQYRAILYVSGSIEDRLLKIDLINQKTTHFIDLITNNINAAFKDLTLNTAWAISNGYAKYRIFNNELQLRLYNIALPDGANLNINNEIIAVLPPGFRPSYTILHDYLRILANGSIITESVIINYIEFNIPL